MCQKHNEIKKTLKFGIIHTLFVECGQRCTDRKIYTLNS